MKQRMTFSTGLIGLIGLTLSGLSVAESNIQAGLVAAVNNSFYKGVENEQNVLPLLIAEYDRFYLKGTEVGYKFFQQDKVQSLALELRRTFDGYTNDDSDELGGMADRDAAWEAGFVYEASVLGGQARAKLMQDVSSSHDGFSGRLDYERAVWVADSYAVSLYTGSEYWSSKKTDYYFGVNPDESTATRAEYVAGDNFEIFVGANAHKRVDESISLSFSAEYLWASDAINDSPVTARRGQWSAHAAVFYQF